MVVLFEKEMSEQVKSLPLQAQSSLRVTLVTGVLAADIVRSSIIEPLNKIEKVESNLVVVQNHFFGEGITVSGLLTGKDILNALEKEEELGDRVYLPPNVLNDDNKLLDDMTLSTLSDQLGISVELFPDHVCNRPGLGSIEQ